MLTNRLRALRVDLVDRDIIVKELLPVFLPPRTPHLERRTVALVRRQIKLRIHLRVLVRAHPGYACVRANPGAGTKVRITEFVPKMLVRA